MLGRGELSDEGVEVPGARKVDPVEVDQVAVGPVDDLACKEIVLFKSERNHLI